MPDAIYVFTNEAMPGLIKIGFTSKSVEERLNTLSSPTGVPLPFDCYFAAEVKDGKRIEKTLHRLFAEFRFDSKREFFRLEPEKVVLAISIGEFKDVTPGIAQVEPEAAGVHSRSGNSDPFGKSKGTLLAGVNEIVAEAYPNGVTQQQLVNRPSSR